MDNNVILNTRRNKYAFGGRLTAAFPSQIIVDVTEVCNLECIHCPHPVFKSSDHYRGSHLSIELNKKLVDEVRNFGNGCTKYIRYTSNGEPLVHPKIYDMLDYSVKNSGVPITLTTNGTILNEIRINKLLDSGLDLIDISIDAYNNDTYSKIRVKGNLETTRDNVIKLLSIRNKSQAKTKIVVSYVEQAANCNETLLFEKFWRNQGVDNIVVRRLHSAAGGVVTIAKNLQASQIDLERTPCLYPWERILLNSRGELSFCPQDWEHGSAIADFTNTNIRDIWQSKAYADLREAHLTNNYSAHSFCGKCPDWKQTRWPGEGRSYADMIQDFTIEKDE